MLSRVSPVIAVLLFALTANAAAPAAAEYAKHFAALSELSVAVAQAMPPDQYAFKPHPESMLGQIWTSAN